MAAAFGHLGCLELPGCGRFDLSLADPQLGVGLRLEWAGQNAEPVSGGGGLGAGGGADAVCERPAGPQGPVRASWAL